MLEALLASSSLRQLHFTELSIAGPDIPISGPSPSIIYFEPPSPLFTHRLNGPPAISQVLAASRLRLYALSKER